MKQIRVEAHGGPEQLRLHDGLSQAPGPNQVRVRQASIHGHWRPARHILAR